MIDQYGRDITYLRISVTDKCNLRCTYCMPYEGVPVMEHENIMSIEEILKTTKAAVDLGIKKIRITGGEPLVRKGILSLCKGIAAIPGVEEVAMTTNGILLPKFAKGLKEAGLRRLNISLDTLNPEKYRRITRIGTLSDALDGIRAAREAGFPIKLNVVLMEGFNVDEIKDFVAMTKENDMDVRFIELMPMGAGGGTLRYTSSQTVLHTLPELQPVGKNEGVADLYQIPGYSGRVGLIQAISCKFCGDCNKIRLTADGKLKPCLHSHREIPIRGLSEEGLKAAITEAVLGKPEARGDLDESHPSDARRNMNQIGG